MESEHTLILIWRQFPLQWGMDRGSKGLSWPVHLSVLFHRKSPPSFWGFEKKGGAFPETAKIFRFWFVFTVGNALKCFGNECFPLKNSNFESCFWKKSRLRRAHFEFPPLPTIPGGLKTAQFRSVPVWFSIDAFSGFCILKSESKRRRRENFEGKTATTTIFAKENSKHTSKNIVKLSKIAPKARKFLGSEDLRKSPPFFLRFWKEGGAFPVE